MISFQLISQTVRPLEITEISLSVGSKKIIQEKGAPIVLSASESQPIFLNCTDCSKIIQGTLEVKYRSSDSGLEFKKAGDLRIIRE